MKVYACYERNFARRWQIVCYHGSRPEKSVNGQTPDRSAFFEVLSDELDAYGNPLFARIQQRKPAPVDEVVE